MTVRSQKGQTYGTGRFISIPEKTDRKKYALEKCKFYKVSSTERFTDSEGAHTSGPKLINDEGKIVHLPWYSVRIERVYT